MSRIYFTSEDYKVIKQCQDEIDELVGLIKIRQQKIDEIIRSKGVRAYEQKDSVGNTVHG